MIFIFIAKIAIFSHFFASCTCTNTLLYVIINLAGLYSMIDASKYTFSIIRVGRSDRLSVTDSSFRNFSHDIIVLSITNLA